MMISQSDIHNAKILIVDDQESNVLLLDRVLRGAGYTSLASTCIPQEVCELYRKNCYDLILLDLVMPGMDGFQVMEGLKEIQNDGYLPVLVITAEPDHKLRALKSGAKDFVGKPLNLPEVLTRVYNMLEVRLLNKTLQFTNEKLTNVNDELRCTNKDLEDFTHIVSHDLQSPLNKIISFGDLLKMNLESPEKALNYLNRIQMGARKMSGLINSILTFSKATTSKEMAPVDMGAIVKEVLSELVSELKEADARVTVENLPTFKANPVQINQLMTNLIGNAIKYCGEEAPLIHISSKKEGGMWVFSVRDNGIGIDPENCERIFHLFQRIESESKDKPGTGIGLTICKKIVENNGGKIWVESELNKGSTFHFTLPE